ncbi:MAG: excinuclease ABC subunit UvrC [Candidatus Woesearchaeota archaeon]
MILIPPDKKLDYTQIPKSPGCYIYKDEQGVIIYIGKAKNLVNRIRSYFANNSQHSVKTKHLVAKIHSVEWIVVDNEIEALLLENNLVKKYSPKYNIDLKDSKTFAYIKITDEKFPRIFSTRKVTKDGTYFGPYTDGYQRVQLIRTAVSIFKIRTCKILPKRACLNYHIGICTAPCINNVDENNYAVQISDAKEFLKGNTDFISKLLTEDMKKFSKELKFEKALEKRNQIEAINGIFEKQKVELIKNFDQEVIAMVQHNDDAIFDIFTVSKGVIAGKSEYRIPYSEEVFEEFMKRYYSTRKIPYEIIVNNRFYAEETDKETLEQYLARLRNQKVVITYPEKGDKLALIRLAEKNAMTNLEENKTLVELQEKLNLPQYPRVIECFDISNLSYDHIVGGMTRFVDGKPDKSGYRKFLIRYTKDKNDDFASMSEVIYRRHKRIKNEKKEYPDLILIDGGLGQLNASLSALKSLGLKIPIITIAKENEEIYTPSDKIPMQFDKNSKMMLLIREIRDSVHRYVLSYNRKRRDMKLRDEFDKV